jgi:hypothetical protein
MQIVQDLIGLVTITFSFLIPDVIIFKHLCVGIAQSV